jgi:hypothetical protein
MVRLGSFLSYHMPVWFLGFSACLNVNVLWAILMSTPSSRNSRCILLSTESDMYGIFRYK